MPKINNIKYLAIPLIVAFLLFSRALADIFISLIGLIFLFYSIKHSQLTWLKDPVVKVAFLCWLYLLFVASPFSTTPLSSFFQSFTWVRFILLYAVINYYILNDRISVKKTALMLMIILTAVAGNLIWEVSTMEQMGRLFGFLSRPNIGIFSAKIGFAAFALYYASLQFESHHSMIRTSYVNLLALTLIGLIVVSGERSTALVTLINIIIVTPLILMTEKKYRKTAATIPLIAIGISFSIYITQPYIQERISTLTDILSNFWASLYGELTNASILIVSDNPIIGVGMKNFEDFCRVLLANGRVSYCNIHPHNIYAEWAVSGGLIGLTLFCYLVFTLFKTVLRHRSQQNTLVVALACGGLIMTFFPFMFTQSFFTNWSAILAWVSISVSVAAVRQTQH